MNRVVDNASGQFIYAPSTVLKHVDDDVNFPSNFIRMYVLSSLDQHQQLVFYVREELADLYSKLLSKINYINAYQNEILCLLEILFEFPSGGSYFAPNHLHCS